MEMILLVFIVIFNFQSYVILLILQVFYLLIYKDHPHYIHIDLIMYIY